MATIHLKETTTATPEQFIAGLTDFGPGRSELFPNSADAAVAIHALPVSLRRTRTPAARVPVRTRGLARPQAMGKTWPARLVTRPEERSR